MKYTGPYKVMQKLRPYFYHILDLVQNQNENVHRLELLPVGCDDDDMTRREHAKGTQRNFSYLKFLTMKESHRKEVQSNFLYGSLSRQANLFRLRRLQIYSCN